MNTNNRHGADGCCCPVPSKVYQALARCRLAALWLVLLAVCSFPAVAEEATGLEEIRVTATRIPVAWSRAPFASAQIDQAAIQQGRQQLGLDESLVSVPGLFFQNRYNFAQDLRISIRGFGARANFGIRGIQLVADDIPLTMPDGQGNVDSIDLGSASSIEVIRGAVSAIYGAAGGGVIRIRTEDGPERPFLAARASGGSYDYSLLQAKAGGQAGGLNWLLNVSNTQLGGYRDHSDYERSLLNSKFRYDFADQSSLTVVFNAVDSPMADDPGALNAGEVAQDRRQAAPRNITFNAGESLEQQKLGLVWRKPLAQGHGLLLRGHAISRDFQARLSFDVNSNGQGGDIDLTREVAGLGGHWSWTRAAASGGENRLVVGASFDQQRDLRRRYANNQGVQGDLTTFQDEDVDASGVFMENALDFAGRFTLSLGARLDDMDYSVNDRTGAGGSGTTSFREFSAMAGLNWALAPTLSLYGNLSTAFDPPAITELANPFGPTGFNQQLDPQTALSSELGLKGQAPNAAWQLVVFHVDVEDEIVPFELAGSGQSFFQNAGSSTHQGVEASFSAELMPGVELVAAYTFSDLKYDEFIGTGGEDFGGMRIPGVPQHLLNVGLSWQHASGFYAAWDGLYAGAFYADNRNSVKTGSYITSDVRAGYRWTSAEWALEPFVGINNLFDESYSGNIRINASFGRYYEPAPLRNFYAGLELRYGF